MTPIIHHVTAYGFRDIPKEFQEKVKVYAMDAMDKDEQSVIFNALEAVALSCRAENIQPRTVQVFITRDGHIELFDDPDCRAELMRLVIIKTDKMKDLDMMRKVVCCVEELCHALWHEDDEIAVKEIVTRVINRYYNKNFGLYDLYRREWIEANKT